MSDREHLEDIADTMRRMRRELVALEQRVGARAASLVHRAAERMRSGENLLEDALEGRLA